jgi:hypothetical protein
MPTFFHNEEERGRRCHEKDAIVRRIVQGLAVSRPEDFHVMAMWRDVACV